MLGDDTLADQRISACNISMKYLRALAVWFVIILAESVHGTLRTIFVQPVLGDLRARQVAFFVGCALILGIAWLFVRWMDLGHYRHYLFAGLMWAALTLVFEVGLGTALGYSRERILEDYDLLNGGLMGLGLILMAFSPMIAGRMRKLI
jgi:hypothetical protein